MDVLNVAEPRAPLLTAAEYQAYARKLADLREIRDRDLPALLRDARGFVASDAAEEIAQIQEDYAVVEERIARLEELIRSAQVVRSDAPPDVVSLGRTVHVKYLRTGAVTSYRVAGVPSIEKGAVSAASPIGRALLGRSPGDLVAVDLPAGRVENLRILAVRPEEDPG
jgi:transcription elongation GreA/GreB family factor